jgi:hypothetical protein
MSEESLFNCYDGHLMDIALRLKMVKKAGYVTSKSKANKDNGNNF